MSRYTGRLTPPQTGYKLLCRAHIRMTSFSIPLLVGPVILALCPAIPAQDAYHVEFGGDGHGNEVAILVNDSKTPIEAFFLSWRCGDGRGGWHNGDTLSDVRGGSFSLMSPTGTTSNAVVVAPGERAGDQFG